jgi:hypothetical protein
MAYIGNAPASGIITGDQVLDGSVKTEDIADGAVTAAKLAAGAAVPSQSGQSGNFLTTDGTNASWSAIQQYSLPTQTGNSGKYLTTDGSNESWGTITQTQGMIHGFDVDPSTGVLTHTAGVTELYDGNFEPLNDAVIVGTDDMTFSVNADGHLIMTIG